MFFQARTILPRSQSFRRSASTCLNVRFDFVGLEQFREAREFFEGHPGFDDFTVGKRAQGFVRFPMSARIVDSAG